MLRVVEAGMMEVVEEEVDRQEVVVEVVDKLGVDLEVVDTQVVRYKALLPQG